MIREIDKLMAIMFCNRCGKQQVTDIPYGETNIINGGWYACDKCRAYLIGIDVTN